MKDVLLIFPHANSGVDGLKSMNTNDQLTGFKQFKNSIVRGLIQKAHFAIPPYGLMLLSSFEDPDISFKLIDTRFHDLPFEEKWDLVGISVHTGAVKSAFWIAKTFREKDVKVVLGGPHVTLFPEECKKFADVLVMGEAEVLWPEVLEDLKQHSLKPLYQNSTFPALGVVPGLKKEALDVQNYFTTNLIQTTRGCPFFCDFCNVSLMSGRTVRHRPIDQVVRDVSHQLASDKRVFFFVDDTINADPEYAEDLFTKLAPLKISWVGQATVGLGAQKRVLKALAKSGCKGLLVGIEGLSDASYKAHHKTQNSAKTLRDNLKRIRSAGICLYGSMIYGLDGDTLETADAIRYFLDEAEIDIPGINLLRPIPGTELFNRLADENRLLFDKNNPEAFRYSWAQEIQYVPKNIEIGAFIESYRALTKEVYTLPNAIKRAMNAPAINVAILAFNLAYIHMYGLSRRDLAYQLNYCL